MFQNKIVAITGAGSGIGQALAWEMARRGARLALSDVNESALAETMTLIPSGCWARAYPLDVSSREAVFQFAEDVNRDFGAVHYIVNNASTALLATVDHVTIEEIEKVLAINLWGVIYGTKAFLPIMLRQKEGCIVNVSSALGLVATPCSAAYTISKFGIRGLTETLWQELDGTGVRGVLVHPGGINTGTGKIPMSQLGGDIEHRMAEANVRQTTTSPHDCASRSWTGWRGATSGCWLVTVHDRCIGCPESSPITTEYLCDESWEFLL